MKARSAIALAATLFASGCGPRLLKLPSGPGAPAPEAAAAVAEALDRCEPLRTLTAEIAVSGTAGGRRVRGRLTAGLAAPASARLEALAPFGQPIFVFVATDDDATVWLPRDQRVLDHARPDVVLGAVAGVPLSAADLWATLTGCPSGTPDPAGARAFGSTWLVVPAGRGGELYLYRDEPQDQWSLLAVTGVVEDGRRWRAEYRNFEDDLPRSIRLTGAGSPAFDLQLTLSQVELNVPLGADVFRVRIPQSATPITVEELRQSGPLAGRSAAGHAR